MPYELAPRPSTSNPYIPVPLKVIPGTHNDKPPAHPAHGHAAAHAKPTGRPSKRQLEEEAEQERSRKKQKMVEVAVPRRGRPPKNKVGMSDSAKKMLNVDAAAQADGRRSGRARMPSLKLREGDSPLTLKLSPRKNAPSSPLTDEPESPTRSPRSAARPSGSTSTSPKSLAVASQPRESNGRFGKKDGSGRPVRKQFFVGARRYMSGYRPYMGMGRAPLLSLENAIEDAEQDEEEDPWDEEESEDEHEQEQVSLVGSSSKMELGEEALEDMVLKRSRDSDESDAYSPKRIRIQERSDDSDLSPQAPPRYLLGQGTLLRPNPISFARRKWATRDDEDDDLPSSAFHKAVDSEGSSMSSPEHSRKGASAHASGSSLLPAARIVDPPLKLTMRPSPMNLARKRWAPLPRSSLVAETQATITQSDQTDTDDDTHVTVTQTVHVSEHKKLTKGVSERPNLEEEAGWYSDDGSYSDPDADDWSEDEVRDIAFH